MNRAIVLFLFLASASCGVPKLESAACTEAKDAVREFYSYHFGHDMKFSPEGLKAREKFLTLEFAGAMSGAPAGTDPFTTGTTDIPRAFRVGECHDLTPERTESEVLLLWRDDARTEQRTIVIETVDKNDRWLVNAISR